MLYQCRDTLFLTHRGWWFVWEPAWEQFRPVQSIVWDGTAYRIDDDVYCSDPTDQLYGYGSEQMRELCELLQSKQDEEPIKVITLPFGTEWFRDRFVALTPCAPRDSASWKRLVQGHGRTCRTAPRGKTLTRRALRKQ